MATPSTSLTKPPVAKQPMPAVWVGPQATTDTTTPQGPAQGGPEVPGTPNTSPSTAATDGLYKAVQQLAPPAQGWLEIPAPEGDNIGLGERTPPPEMPIKVLGRLVRGVY